MITTIGENSVDADPVKDYTGDAYLLDADNIMHGPYGSLHEAAATTLGDYPGIVDFALGPLHTIAVILKQRNPDVWAVVGDVRSLQSRRCDHLASFLTSLSQGDARIMLVGRLGAIPYLTSLAELGETLHSLQGRHVPMRVQELGDLEIASRPVASDLVEAWIADRKEWGSALNRIIELHKLRANIVAVNMSTLSFEWSGPALTFLDSDPGRLYQAPITALRDKAFVDGIIVDLHRATAASRPYLCEIATPLNGVDVEYQILSLPLHDGKTGKIISCMRVPLELTVKAPPPPDYQHRPTRLKTNFLYT